MPGKHLQFPLTVGPLTAVPTDSCLILQLSDLTVVWSYSCPHWQLSDLTVVWSYSCLIWQLISDSCLLTRGKERGSLPDGYIGLQQPCWPCCSSTSWQQDCRPAWRNEHKRLFRMEDGRSSCKNWKTTVLEKSLPCRLDHRAAAAVWRMRWKSLK